MVKKNKTFKEALNNWLKDEAKVQVLPSEVNDVKQLTDKEINYLSNKCELEFADRSFKIGDVNVRLTKYIDDYIVSIIRECDDNIDFVFYVEWKAVNFYNSFKSVNKIN